jgi:AraC-like DNA-binding protein
MFKQSFYEASAIKQRTIFNPELNENIACFGSLNDRDDGLQYLPSIQKLLLIESVKHGNFQASANILDDIFSYMESGGFSNLHVRFLHNELLYLLLETGRQLNINLSQNLVFPILSFDSIIKTKKNYELILDRLCAAFQKNLSDQKTKIRNQILLFIGNNYKNPVFSMDLASDTLKISKSKIRAVIKDTFGYSFAQYVAFMRMNEFKRLLIESNESIQNIVKEIGYLDTANFLRKFKQTEGCTPSQYRKIQKIPPKLSEN